MSLDRAPTDVRTLSGVADLLDTFREAEKPQDQFQVGLEHERFVYPRDSSQAVGYSGSRGIGALLGALERPATGLSAKAPTGPPSP